MIVLKDICKRFSTRLRHTTVTPLATSYAFSTGDVDNTLCNIVVGVTFDGVNIVIA
jgi:hypothetical protein